VGGKNRPPTLATFNRWQATYGVMKSGEAKCLMTLEGEQALDIDMLRELAEGNSGPGASSQDRRGSAAAFWDL
jgi:hypothetical protein